MLKPELTPEDIIQITADYFHVPIKKVLSPDQHWIYAEPRRISMYFIKQNYPNMSFQRIANYYQGKNDAMIKSHATVMFAIRTVKNSLDVDLKARKIIKEIEWKLKSSPAPIKMQIKIVLVFRIYYFRKSKRFYAKPILPEPEMIKVTNDFRSPFNLVSSCTNQPYHGYLPKY